MDGSRERYLARHRRYNRSEKGRARWRRYYDKRMEDFTFRALEGMRKRAHHAATRQAAREEAGFVPNEAIQSSLDQLLPAIWERSGMPRPD